MSEHGAAVFVVAILTIRAGAEREFREFETRAARILERYGAGIERTITVEPSAAGEPREVHLLRFPSRDAFARYRSDPELASMAGLRAEAIANTEILMGHEGPRY